MEQYLIYIIFFHVLSAIIWVGGMIAIRFAVHPALRNIEDTKIRLARTLEITGRLFALVMPFVLIIFITGLIMGKTFGFSGHTDLSKVVHIKEAIWLIMALNYTAMIFIRFRAQNAFLISDFEKTKKLLSFVAKYLLPLNIFLGVMELFFGLILRGF